MSVAEIVRELPKLTAAERELVARRLQELEARRENQPRPSLKDFKPLDLGKPLKPITTDDLLEEMIDEAGR